MELIVFHNATPGSAAPVHVIHPFVNSNDNITKGISVHTKGPSNITVLMTVMKIDELFSFCDFGGSGREEGHRAA